MVKEQLHAGRSFIQAELADLWEFFYVINFIGKGIAFISKELGLVTLVTHSF